MVEPKWNRRPTPADAVSSVFNRGEPAPDDARRSVRLEDVSRLAAEVRERGGARALDREAESLGAAAGDEGIIGEVLASKTFLDGLPKFTMPEMFAPR
jgi:hypothetical protein